ncbi:MAG TPA: type VI secretion protein IcmF/TssM N-terminal domain-containing protein [Verrucomicrobiae bacterium]
MDENTQIGGIVKWGLGAAGLGAVASAVFLRPYGIFVAVVVLVLAVLLFGGYYLWRRMRARREREQFTSAIEAQTAATPKAISDPNKRADLDRVRQKFQAGLQEYKSRGKDLYKLPWYVIIGESGSGKTEAIRHSGIDFPPGLQDELQGSGGTVNMDWWFTNRGIILDTAGSMLFNEARAGEAPEWREFLRLLKRARPRCPVNGLFLVLSVESLIRDSADTIAQKASRLAQQLDLIQRVLDVRFPVYLVVTKCDLLAGFREFFDNIDDPLLQHQMFGWSNPDPLDAAFRPDLVDQYLRSVAGRLRRRRMALIRDTSGTGRLGDTQHFFKSAYQLGVGPTTLQRRLDEVDSLFALPESVMRLAPRLRRYLETVFVAGEWSAKPVFLRGIYFTSSMREGKALDEAIALATGLQLDQLPEDRSWEKNRAFFLRDLFHEKVFRESGLVTRATNTLQLLRQRQLAIFGSVAVALLLLLLFAGLGYRKLGQSVRDEAFLWQAGATNWVAGQDEWSPPIVRPEPGGGNRFVYAGADPMPNLGKTTVAQYHKKLRDTVEKPLQVSWIFQPVALLRRLRSGADEGRPEAQRLVFEGGVLKPLVARTRDKLLTQDPTPGNPESLQRHRQALEALIQLEADGVSRAREPLSWGHAEECFRPLLSYLTETTSRPDTNLTETMVWTYDTSRGSRAAQWPPPTLLLGNSLAKNPAISNGLERFQIASTRARTNIDQQLDLLNDLTDQLTNYQKLETVWLDNPNDASCTGLAQAEAGVQASWRRLADADSAASPLTNLSVRYLGLQSALSNASALAISPRVRLIWQQLPDNKKATGLVPEVLNRLGEFGAEAAARARTNYNSRLSAIARLDTDYLPRTTNSPRPAFETRWSLYSDACALASTNVAPTEGDIGSGWLNYTNLNQMAEAYRTNLESYKGPLAAKTSEKCQRIASTAIEQLKTGYLSKYAQLLAAKLNQTQSSPWNPETVATATRWLSGGKSDLDSGKSALIQSAALTQIEGTLSQARQSMLTGMRQALGQAAGFPVVLTSAQQASVDDLAKLRKLLEAMSRDLTNNAWECASLKAFNDDRLRYESVVNGLITSEGTPAEWEFRILPPKPGDDDMARVYTRTWVTIGGGPATPVSTPIANSSGVLLGKAKTNDRIKISFRRSDNDNIDTPGLAEDSWGLVGLILHGDQVERLDEGKVWQIHIKPKSPASAAVKGSILFEARLGNQRLPTLQSWPGSK